MKNFLSILAVVIICMAVWKLWDYYAGLNRAPPPPEAVPTGRVQTLPPKMEESLAEAYKKGAPGLQIWLDTFRNSPALKDPRLAAIELDYLVLLSRTDPVAAKRIFADVKQRTPPNSPVYPRIKELEKTYE